MAGGAPIAKPAGHAGSRKAGWKPALRSEASSFTCRHGGVNLEKAVGTAEYAKHAKAERVGEEDRFTQRVNDLVSLTPFPFAYLAYFEV